MNYSCDNCQTDSNCLISHPAITGDASFCLACFRQMGGSLFRLKKHCPVCGVEIGHREDCIYKKLMEEHTV